MSGFLYLVPLKYDCIKSGIGINLFSRLQMARICKINGETLTLTFACIGKIFLALPLWNGLHGHDFLCLNLMNY